MTGYYDELNPRVAVNHGQRIFEGIGATPHEFPFMVEVQINGVFACGGSLIGKISDRLF